MKLFQIWVWRLLASFSGGAMVAAAIVDRRWAATIRLDIVPFDLVLTKILFV